MFVKNLATPGPRTPGARKGLNFVLKMVGVVFAMRFAVPGMIQGGKFISGGENVTAGLDNEARFLFAMMGFLSILWFWLSTRFEKETKLLVTLACMVLLGGFLRIVSVALYGPPSAFILSAAAVEFILPIITLWLLTKRDPASVAEESAS